jgi:hypothetical protein
MFRHLLHFVCLFVYGYVYKCENECGVVCGSKVLCVAEICVGIVSVSLAVRRRALVLASGIDLAFNGFFFTFHFSHLESRASASESSIDQEAPSLQLRPALRFSGYRLQP